MPVEVVTPATDPVLTPAEVRDHFKQVEAAEDGLLASYISAATAVLEDWLRRAFMVRTLKLHLKSFRPAHHMIEPVETGEILLPYAPLASVVDVYYTDSNGDPQEFTDYQEDLLSEPGRILPNVDSAWPTVGGGYVNAARIQYTAGYADAGAVPEKYKQLIRWTVAVWYRNREPVAGAALHEVPFTVSDWVTQNKAVWRLT